MTPSFYLLLAQPRLKREKEGVGHSGKGHPCKGQAFSPKFLLAGGLVGRLLVVYRYDLLGRI